jgi:hypothetical protein
MSIMQALGYPSEMEAKSKLLTEVRAAGATRLEANYSGGNDEGGVTDIRLLDAEGKEMPAPDSTFTRDPKPGDDKWRIRDGKVHEYHPLWEAADRMLQTEFGSWAGEFSAYGTLFVDTTQNKVWRDGEMQSGYDSDGHEY